MPVEVYIDVGAFRSGVRISDCLQVRVFLWKVYRVSASKYCASLFLCLRILSPRKWGLYRTIASNLRQVFGALVVGILLWIQTSIFLDPKTRKIWIQVMSEYVLFLFCLLYICIIMNSVVLNNESQFSRGCKICVP